MPINTKTRARDTTTGTSKMAPGDQMVALFGFIGLHGCRPALEGLMAEAGSGRRGRKSPYQPLALLATLGAARAAGSLAMALKMLNDEPGLWDRCNDAYEARCGSRLPPVPPTREQVRYLRDLIIKSPETLNQLQRVFRRVAVGQAQQMGNLVAGVEPDGAAPNGAHLIYGDGTNIAKYTDVREVVHPITGEIVVVGSRATDPTRARIQRLSTDTREDDKTRSGLNMVSMHTWTSAGRVVLGTAVALGAEQWAALDLAEQLHHLAGDGIHGLIYDRAVTGWQVDHLMANHRIQVIGKAVGAGSDRSAEDRTAIEQDLSDTVRRRAAEYGAKNTTDITHLLRRDVLSDMLRYHERLPLGLCIYPTSRRNFDLVRGSNDELEPVEHDTPSGTCTHRIALDDGGLFEVEDHPEDGYAIKVRVLRCRRSTPYQRKDGRWGTRNEYTIPCASGDVDYTRTWEPEGTRYTPGSKEKTRSPKDSVGWRLRPLSRAEDIAAWYNADPDEHVNHFTAPRPFSDVYSRRNDSESYNEWYQRSLPHHGRAASLDPAAQELDFLLGALLNNTITWHHRSR
jgi:hypothetical protein